MPPERKSDPYGDLSDQQLHTFIDAMPVDESCDVVRQIMLFPMPRLFSRKIRNLIDSGEYLVKDFLSAINHNSTSYSRFMSQNGPHKGAGSDVYIDAWRFLKKRELRGVKAPRKKTKQDEGDKENESPVATASTPAKKNASKKSDPIRDLSSIHLDGEDEDRVPIFNTCDEIRRKISAYLGQPGITQAAFLRALAAQSHATPNPPIHSHKLAAHVPLTRSARKRVLRREICRGEGEDKEEGGDGTDLGT
ncbi:hypothetical protein M011DRAFT_488644 [Sporormia fimetaria CBS 119925]|uniref:DUF7726 domain-containing protein n=1 Tax=Sporormia fimetaria CBS 119925 TaxID=1340428 RepID=A0A6A6V2N2_9PLEO|nr:hypothetical protein M011DRAFT_488644 [Sporormia fimetaria CBS 119925]